MEGQIFKVTLSYIMSLRLTWAIGDLVSEKNPTNRQINKQTKQKLKKKDRQTGRNEIEKGKGRKTVARNA